MITVSNVANASRGELLCITYQLLLEQIEKLIEADNKEDRKPYKEKSVEIIKMLAGDLNFDYELSHQLFHLYVYVQGLIIKGTQKEAFEEAYSLVDKIYQAYKKVTDEEEDKKAVMQNTEVVYAGLTYSKNNVNELKIEDHNRGFKA